MIKDQYRVLNAQVSSSSTNPMMNQSNLRVLRTAKAKKRSDDEMSEEEPTGEDEGMEDGDWETESGDEEMDVQGSDDEWSD